MYIDDRRIVPNDPTIDLYVASYRTSIDIITENEIYIYVTYYDKDNNIYISTPTYLFNNPEFEPYPIGEIVFDFENNKIYLDDTETKLFSASTDEEIQIKSIIGVLID